jgi:hypothetical protein
LNPGVGEISHQSRLACAPPRLMYFGYRVLSMGSSGQGRARPSWPVLGWNLTLSLSLSLSLSLFMFSLFVGRDSMASIASVPLAGWSWV